MKKKEKANEIGKKRARQYHHNTFEGGLKNNEFVFSDEECMKSALEMAEWMIEKACKWLKDDMLQQNAFQGRWERLEIIDGIIERFKKAMEE